MEKFRPELAAYVTLPTMGDLEWQEGGCFCGAVRFHVRGDAIWKSGCTCNTCVKMHAAPYVVVAGFDRDNFELILGRLTQFRSSPHVIREFCPNCGSTLTYAKDARGAPELEEAARAIYVAVASLDNPDAYPPDEVVHTQEAIGWIKRALGMFEQSNYMHTYAELLYKTENYEEAAKAGEKAVALSEGRGYRQFLEKYQAALK